MVRKSPSPWAMSARSSATQAADPGLEVVAGEGVEPAVALDAADCVAPRERAGDGQLGGVVELTGVEARPERLAHVLARRRAGGRRAGRTSSGRAGWSPSPIATAHRRWCSKAASRSPHSSSRSRANARMVSSNRYELVSSSRTTRLLSTSDASTTVRSTPSEQRAQRLQRVELEAGREDGEVAEQTLLGLLEQRIAPVDGGAHRLVPGFAASGPGRQAVGGVVEAAAQLGQAPAAHLPGRQLDGERQPVEAGAEVDDLRRPTASHGERGSSRRARSTNSSAAAAPRGSTGTRCSSPSPSGSRLVARMRHVPPQAERDVDQLGGGVDHVLAVVEHDQHRTVGEVGAELGAGSGGVAFDAERVGHRPEHVAGGAGRHEIDEHRSLRPALDVLVADGQGDARLAHTARTDQRGEPGLLELGRDHLDQVGPADQLGAQRREPTVERRGSRRRRAARRPSSGGAIAASARRLVAPSLRSSDETCVSTVRTETNSCSAISAFVSRRCTSASTSASRAVSVPAGPAAHHRRSLPNPWFPRRRTRVAHGCARSDRSRAHAGSSTASAIASDDHKESNDVHPRSSTAADTVLPHPGSPPTPALLDAIRDGAAVGDDDRRPRAVPRPHARRRAVPPPRPQGARRRRRHGDGLVRRRARRSPTPTRRPAGS